MFWWGLTSLKVIPIIFPSLITSQFSSGIILMLVILNSFNNLADHIFFSLPGPSVWTLMWNSLLSNFCFLSFLTSVSLVSHLHTHHNLSSFFFLGYISWQPVSLLLEGNCWVLLHQVHAHHMILTVCWYSEHAYLIDEWMNKGIGIISHRMPNIHRLVCMKVNISGRIDTK